MRSICKGGEPRALIEWRRQNAATPDNLHYNGGDFPREAVRQSLLLEQCHLCAYTLKRLATAAECAEHGHDSVLNLNHPVLVQARKAAVRGYLYPKKGKPLSAAAARRLVLEVMRPDGEQCLPAYCVAVACAARAFAEREERRAARMRKQGTTR